MVRLFIEGEELDLDKNVQFAITKLFEELSNPTIICNDWSKTVSIPFTNKNDKIFGHIYNPDKVITASLSRNLLGAPTSIMKWDGTGYVDDSLVNGLIVCPITTQYIQLGFINDSWSYTETQNYNCNNDTHSYVFVYNPVDLTRIEFSFRDPNNAAAPNNEVYYAQWALSTILTTGKKYNITFSHKRVGNDYIIYNYSLYEAESNKKNIGIYFDPTKKLDFRLEYDNTVLMTGYAKMIDIKRSKGTGTYNITLNGLLGKVFQEMKKITFDIEAPESEDDYIIRGAKYVNTAINKELVYNSWHSSGQMHSILTKTGDSRYIIDDIIGFAPNNSFCEDFDYKTYLPNSTTSNTFANALGNDFKTATGIDGGSVIPNGLLPRELGEYRSYYQLPYIYWNKLFQIFQEKAEELTGYTFELDETWFNEANPYWYYLVYMLKPLFQSNSASLKGEDIANTYTAFDRKKYSFSYKDTSDSSNKKLYVTQYDSSNNISYTPYTYTNSTTSHELYTDGFSYSVDDNKNVNYTIDNSGSSSTATSSEHHRDIIYPYPSSSFTNMDENIAMYENANLFQFNTKYVYAKVSLNLDVTIKGELEGDIKWTSGTRVTGGGMAGNHPIPTTTIVEYSETTAFNPQSMLVLDVIFRGTTSNREQRKKILIAGSAVQNYSGDNATLTSIWNYILSNPDATVQYVDNSTVSRTYNSTTNTTTYTKRVIITTPEFEISNGKIDDEFTVSYEAYWFNPMKVPFYGPGVYEYNATRFAQWLAKVGAGQGVRKDILINTGCKYETTVDTTMTMNLNFTNNTKHYSGDTFILNDLWNKEYNLFDEIIKYCKMFRINISVDDVNKKIVFQRMKKLFSNYAVRDWTDKLDKSKDYTIKPITFDKKYALFNYKDSKTYLAEEYKKKYGLNFGEYKLITDYNFNSDTENLFKDVKTSIVNTDNVLSWTNLFNRHVIEYSVADELYVDCKNKDKKFEDVFGQFYFHNGIKNFNTETALHMRPVVISDDTTLLKNTNTYFYNGGGETDKRVFISTYPHLDVVRGDNMLLFNIPKYNFTYVENYADKHPIYYNLWNNYINERYNIQNKLVTCYLRLKPSDYSAFKWSNFIKIENQLYFVNKIYDYDITSSNSTKVDLVTVQNVDAYTTDNYDFDYIVARPNSLMIPYDYYKKITIYSTTPWRYYDSGDAGEFITVYPESGDAGETEVLIGAINEDNGYTAMFLQIDPITSESTNEISVVCEVGGNSTILVDNWFYLMVPGQSVSFTITSKTIWHLLTTKRSGNNNASLSMTSGFAGAVSVTMTAGSTGTGHTDFYIENAGGDIVMIRAYVEESTIYPSNQYLTLSAGGQSTTVRITDSASGGWTLWSHTGSADITVSPTTGTTGTTDVTFTPGSTTGKNTYTFRSASNNSASVTVTVI